MSNGSIDIDGFRIVRRIGTGARTTIYLATDEATGQTVALKRAVLERDEDARIFEQIQVEYKVARRIDHPYVRKCHRLIKQRKLLKTTELLLSMEMFYGKSLEESPGLSLGDILLVFRMIATGINAMHEAGFVHCDIKPNNILVSRKGALKIIDLGQSCRIGAIKARIQGTPDYIAPEQVQRKHLSHRTDIFNLGATMYWALTGKNIPTLIPKKVGVGLAVPVVEIFKTPHEIYRKIPEAVSQLVMDCVQQKPADRPANMSEIIARLDMMIREIFSNKFGGNGAAR